VETIHVVAAIIFKLTDEGTLVLASQRGKGKFIGKWEFPGGKVEPGESLDQAVRREIDEELGVQLVNVQPAYSIDTEISDNSVCMHFFWAQAENEEFKQTIESRATQWVAECSLYDLDWMEADREVLPMIAKDIAD